MPSHPSFGGSRSGCQSRSKRLRANEARANLDLVAGQGKVWPNRELEEAELPRRLGNSNLSLESHRQYFPYYAAGQIENFSPFKK